MQDNLSIEPLLREQEAALILNVPVRTLHQWRYHGRGAPYVKLTRSVRYRRSDLARYIAENVLRPGNAGRRCARRVAP